jgi:hypothetical protein
MEALIGKGITYLLFQDSHLQIFLIPSNLNKLPVRLHLPQENLIIPDRASTNSPNLVSGNLWYGGKAKVALAPDPQKSKGADYFLISVRKKTIP